MCFIVFHDKYLRQAKHPKRKVVIWFPSYEELYFILSALKDKRVPEKDCRLYRDNISWNSLNRCQRKSARLRVESEFKRRDLALLGRTTGLPFKHITDMLIDSQRGGRVSGPQIALRPRIFCALSRDLKESYMLGNIWFPSVKIMNGWQKCKSNQLARKRREGLSVGVWILAKSCNSSCNILYQ